jgi:hypothetical protein
MSETAFKIQYRDEFISGFEQGQSLIRNHTTTEAVINGNQATFLVADSGNAEPVTRGVNGLIQARGDNLNQPVATLIEWHDLVRKTRFNIFASQGNQRAIMQKTSMGVINRKIDQDILTELNTGSQYAGNTAAAATLTLVMRAKTILGNAEVPWDSNICGIISPAMEAYLMTGSTTQESFASRDYVGNMPMSGADLAWRDKPREFYWMGVFWLVHPRLPGSEGAGADGTEERCFMFHKSAIGHAYNSDNIQALTGYKEEQDYSWARTSIFMGSAVLQDTGIVIMKHDGSAFTATGG